MNQMINYNAAVPVHFTGPIPNLENNLTTTKNIRNKFHATANLPLNVCKLQIQRLKMLPKLNNFIKIAYAMFANRSIPRPYRNTISGKFKMQWDLFNGFDNSDELEPDINLPLKVHRLIASKNGAKYVKSMVLLSGLSNDIFPCFKKIFPLYKNVTHFNMPLYFSEVISISKILQLMTLFRNIENICAASEIYDDDVAVIRNFPFKRISKLKTITLKNYSLGNIIRLLKPIWNALKMNGIAFNISQSMFTFSDEDVGDYNEDLVLIRCSDRRFDWLNSLVKSMPITSVQKIVKFDVNISVYYDPLKFTKFLTNLIQNATNLHTISIYFGCGYSDKNAGAVVDAFKAVGKELKVNHLRLVNDAVYCSNINALSIDMFLNVQSLNLKFKCLSPNGIMPNLKRLVYDLSDPNSEEVALQILRNALNLEELTVNFCTLAHFKETQIFGRKFKNVCKKLKRLSYHTTSEVDNLLHFIGYIIGNLPKLLEFVDISYYPSSWSFIPEDFMYFSDNGPNLADIEKYILQLKRLQKIVINCIPDIMGDLDQLAAVIPECVVCEIGLRSEFYPMQ